MTRISVGLLTYNAQAQLPALLDGLAHQTRLPDELIAFDDASSDESAAMLDAFRAEAPFPVLTRVHDRRRGPIEGAQEVFAACTGDVIAVHDQSDRWDPDKLRSFDTKDDIGLEFSDGRLDTGTLWDAAGLSAARRDAAMRGELLPLVVVHPFISAGTMAFGSDLRELLLPIPHHVSIDTWISVLATLVRPYAMIERPLLFRETADVIAPSGTMPGAQGGKWKGARTKMSAPEADRHRQRRRAQAAAYAAIVERYNERSSQYLAAHGLEPQPLAAAALEDMGARIVHLEARGKLPDRRTSRLPIIVRELRSGRYNRYSAGVLSALQDLAY